jgi:hypothetical protein
MTAMSSGSLVPASTVVAVAAVVDGENPDIDGDLVS